MTTESDILGRKPIRKPAPKSVPADDDWRGEGLLKVKRRPPGSDKFSPANAARKAAKVRRS